MKYSACVSSACGIDIFLFNAEISMQTLNSKEIKFASLNMKKFLPIFSCLKNYFDIEIVRERVSYDIEEAAQSYYETGKTGIAYVDTPVQTVLLDLLLTFGGAILFLFVLYLFKVI